MNLHRPNLALPLLHDNKMCNCSVATKKFGKGLELEA